MRDLQALGGPVQAGRAARRHAEDRRRPRRLSGGDRPRGGVDGGAPGAARQSARRHEQNLSDGRCILIEERRTAEGGVIGLRVDITEMKRREASFRLLFDANPVPMFVCALDGHRIVAVNDAAIEHYGYARDALLTMRLCDIHHPPEHPDLPCLDGEAVDTTGRTWRHRKADAHRSTSPSSRACSPGITSRRR